MAVVKFTTALKRFFPTLKTVEVSGDQVKDIIEQLDEVYPGIRDYIVEEKGNLRKHVNIYIGDTIIHDRTHLKDKVSDRDEILIFQALSGG